MLRPRFWPRIWCKTIYCSGRNKTFWPKEAVSAEIDCFGRKKCFGQNFGFGRNFGFSREPCFGFGVSAKNLFRLTTTFQTSESTRCLKAWPWQSSRERHSRLPSLGIRGRGFVLDCLIMSQKMGKDGLLADGKIFLSVGSPLSCHERDKLTDKTLFL